MSVARLPSIALVVHDCQVSYGQGRYVVELLRHLTGRYEFHVFANRFDPDLPPATVLHPVRAWRAQAITSVLSFLLASESQIRRSGCALIHAQGLTCWSADLITAHVCNAARYAHAPAASWRSRLFPALIIPLERAFYRARRRRHVIALSRVLAGEIRQRYGWQKALSVIPHGTDAERFRPARDAAERAQARARYGLTGAMWTWLFVGEASKGLREVIDRLGSFPTARVLVISRSPREPFLARAAAAGLADRVLWHGLEREPEHAYRAADALVFPSNYDAFGLVVTEAMASGLPVIVSRHIGAAELIENRSTGLLVDPGDARQLEAALTWLHQNPAGAVRLGQAARRAALGFTWADCAARTAQVYDQLLAAAPAAAAPTRAGKPADAPQPPSPAQE